jgi:hypothetical protein
MPLGHPGTSAIVQAKTRVARGGPWPSKRAPSLAAIEVDDLVTTVSLARS